MIKVVLGSLAQIVPGVLMAIAELQLWRDDRRPIDNLLTNIYSSRMFTGAEAKKFQARLN